ncbi:cytochrome c [Nitrosospira sp. NRS527]|uniref:c-type cytochrome n=1 Tax=Nitrosospira sp. NRS527 TaxID=155925 RepID=UPI001AF39D84|nr:cytochrome c [Nitrosospira sp. NRS527]BCT66861.1 Alcohol dehydrogenase (quinone), cytochrome c subunit [Nitrosospira sp. NRS527]
MKISGMTFRDSISRALAASRSWAAWVASIALGGMIVANAQAADPETIALGEYLAKVADCTSCHTAGPHHPPFSGGLPINSPFGVIYSTNITPDPATGIGRYSYADFSRAVREGIARDGRRLYPAMPYASFAAATDNDMQALYAYFMEGVKPVRHTPPPTRLIFPFSQRWGLMFWSAAFANQKTYQPRTDRDTQWNRGAYLVQVLGHCGACHTPRGLAFQQKGYSESSPDYLSGAVIDNWFAGNLTGTDASGLGRWSEAEISTFLETGHSGHSVAFGSMVTVIENSTQHLHKADLDAIAHYLKSLPAKKGKTSYKPLVMQGRLILTGAIPSQFERPGAGLYSGFCAKCHRGNGTGKSPQIPRLGGNAMVLSENASSLIRLMLEGGKAPLTKHGPKPKKMPSYEKKFSDREIADVLTFVRNSWGNAAPAVTTRDVSLLRKALRDDQLPQSAP